jgi:anti-sigma B factor antagonist
MEITIKTEGEITIVGIEGRLDTTNYSILENKLISLIDDGHVKIILDGSKMDYISSSGLRVLLMALKRISLVKGKFVLSDLQETIREIFEIAGFTTIFEIFRTKEEALKAIGNRQ